MADQSLKNKTVKGVGWSAIDSVAQHTVTFVVGIVLARLLTPEDYGLIGIISIFTAICTTLINAGFTNALIRKKDATDDDYNTVFIINLGMSLLLYAIIFLCAPLIAVFFHREELVDLTRVSSLSMVVGALALIQQTRLTKKIDFKSQTIITMIASVTSGVIGISMALLGVGVWALVAQSLSSRIINTILLWFVNKWVPHLRFSSASFHELFGFGWKLMASSLLDTTWKELYQVIVGRFYSPGSLGQFTRAKGYSDLLSKNITHIVQRVTYPVLSDIQDNQKRMLSAYRKIIKITMFVSFVLVFFLGAISEPLIYCMIGPKWHDAAVYLPLTCVVGSLFPLHAINLNMLKVQGRSDLFLGLEIIKKIIEIGPLMVGAFIGILPMLYSMIFTSIIGYFLNSYYSGKFLGYNSLMQIKDIAPSFGVATVVASSVFFLKYLPFSYWVVLPIQFVLGGAVFFLICHCIKPEEYVEIKSIARTYLIRLKK